jgi:Holliday junction DNA helicase RuvA
VYDFIKGKIVEKKATSVVLEVNGIGYTLHIPISTYDKIGKVGDEGKLFIYLYIRDNDLKLFGFATTKERIIFESLLKVSNIGPKIAISILSSISPEDLIEVVSNHDVELLSTLPGIGKKSSERIIVELKDKFESLSETISVKNVRSPEDKKMISDAENALISLGYNKNIVQREIRKFLSMNKPTSSEEIVRAIIKHLYKA